MLEGNPGVGFISLMKNFIQLVISSAGILPAGWHAVFVPGGGGSRRKLFMFTRRENVYWRRKYSTRSGVGRIVTNDPVRWCWGTGLSFTFEAITLGCVVCIS
jgi:hypothetical protein